MVPLGLAFRMWTGHAHISASMMWQFIGVQFMLIFVLYATRDAYERAPDKFPPGPWRKVPK
jgi:hypothetical protein